MQQGTIAGLTDKGFGFIKVEGMEKDLFFHSKELRNADFDSLQVGDTLEFEVSESPKGQQATNVSKV